MMEIFSRRLLFAPQNANAIKKGEIIFEKSVAGMYSVDIPADGIYEIVAVGGGGGCEQTALGALQYTTAVSSSGGSGAVVHGLFRVNAGTISVIVGALGASANTSQSGRAGAKAGGATSVGLLCQVGGGGAGIAAFQSPILQEGGAAGTVTSYDSTALTSSILISSGNAGASNRWYYGNRDGVASTAVVQSPYPPYGTGSAGTATTRYNSASSFTNTPGSAGYVKISYYGK